MVINASMNSTERDSTNQFEFKEAQFLISVKLLHEGVALDLVLQERERLSDNTRAYCASL